ncbi:MAG: hypothetical protein ACJAQT_004145 [Akkermansiaceae bacterium]|jgi:hypothetical protein
MFIRIVFHFFFLSGSVQAADGILFFESKVRPILDEHCLKCHSEAKKVKGGLLLDRKAGWEEGGDSGSVIVPGKPEESLLVQMVRHEAEVEAMPPKSKLSDAEILVLSEWVKMGSPDPRAEAIGEEVKTSGFDLEERMKWWSLQPVRRVEIPEVKNEGWPRTELDRFVLAALEKKDWEAAKEADRVTLFRRVSVVLTGLAPTLDELERFMADEGEGSYERVVERLLGSPHFGEQWARHWMDVVRYGESKAFEQDYWMPYTWRYRDYLIRAFNEDVPFDQFVREALAGDLLEDARINPENGRNESVAGPGFLQLADGHHGVTDLHEDEARVIDSMINTVGTAFHGLTISCARCHDHKFDAITDEDYYSLYGMFRSSRLNYANTVDTKWTSVRGDELRKAHGEVVNAAFAGVASRVGELGAMIAAARKLGDDKDLVKKWQGLKPGDHEERAGFVGELESRTSPQGARWFGVLYGSRLRPELAGMKALINSARPKPSQNMSLPQREWLVEGVGFEEAGEGQFLVKTNDPPLIHGAVGAGMVAGHLSSRLDGSVRSEDFILDGEPLRIWVKGNGGTVSLVIRNYELVGHGPTTGPLRKSVNSDEWKLVQFPTTLWKGEVAFLQVQHQGGAKRVLRPTVPGVSPSDDAWVGVATELPDWGKVWASKGSIVKVIQSLLSEPVDGAGAEVLGALFASGLLEFEGSGLKEKRESLEKLRKSIAVPVYVRSMVEGTSVHEPIYIRGNHKRPSEEENPRRFLMGLGGELMTGPGSGRREWVEHLVSLDNPLTARVRVNRVWSRVFGRGLVASVDDFGKMGEPPSHPELLDFLARDFVKEKWSIKAMIRKMVLSSTFRMSSVPSYQANELDPGNVSLQRMSVRRMSAESIRDHILAGSGDLKRDLFGPSVLAYIADQPNSRAKPRNGPLGGGGRRSLYLASRRNYLPSFLRAFNSPNATEPIGRRNVTTVPAQSLALLNHPLVHQQSKIWGERVMESEGSDEAKLKRLHQVAFSREASADEIAWGVSALEKLTAGSDKKGAWISLCHIFMNRKEFIYVL